MPWWAKALLLLAVLPWHIAGLAVEPAGVGGLQPGDAALLAQIKGEHRSDANRLRDAYLHPYDTLRFFGVRKNSVVVEIWPRLGWWTEILAPYLAGSGQYIAALPPVKPNPREAVQANFSFRAKLSVDAQRYGRVIMTRFPDDGDFIPPASADVILSSRNINHWLADGTAPKAFAAFFKALKKGGVLGLEDHRARVDQAIDPLAKSGYVIEDLAVKLAEQAGFKLTGRSEINANPKDTKDHPAGVWTLPPIYKLNDQDRAKYEAIGESDRFTLKFVKP